MVFGTSKKAVDYNEAVETIIGANSKFKGVINSEGSIRIDGVFEGEINSSGDVFVGPKGEVTAQIRARCANIAGSVTGNVILSDKMYIMSTGKMYGDITVGLLTIDEGAIFKGASQMTAEKEDNNENY